MILNTQTQLHDPNTVLIADFQGWFNGATGKHRRGVCTSNDTTTIRKQVLTAHSVGIQGLNVDWYGPEQKDFAPPTDETTKLMFPILEEMEMGVCVTLDAGAFKYTSPTTTNWYSYLETLIDYLKETYFWRPNYLQVGGLPMVLEFGWREQGISVDRLQKAHPEIAFFCKDQPEGAAKRTFAWTNGFPPRDNPKAYLERYLNRNDETMIPCIFDGFDDHNPAKPTESIWGGPARLIQKGNWETCVDLINEAADRGKKFPYVQICTWNDYDEGTEIEPTALRGWRLK